MKPASVTQIRKSKDGRWVGIDQDLLEILTQLKEIDDRLSVKLSTTEGYFAIYERNRKGEDELILTTHELDQRVVDWLRFVGSEDYSLAKALDQQDRDREKAIDDRFTEEIGETGERLAHALRKDLQYGGKVFVSKEVKDGSS